MKEINQIIFSHLNDEATTEEVRVLFEWIQKDPENAKEFARHALLHAQLRGRLEGEYRASLSGEIPAINEEDLAEYEQAVSNSSKPTSANESQVARKSDSKRKTKHKRKRNSNSRKPLGMIIGFAVAATLLVGLGLLAMQLFSGVSGAPTVATHNDDATSMQSDSLLASDPQKNKPFLTLTHLKDVQWSGESSKHASKMGDRLGVSTFELESGFVRLRFDHGVEITLEGPAKLEIVAAAQTKLAYGVLVSSVPPGAEGFQVETPTTRVVDLGTAFGLDVDRDGVSLVSVFDGVVEVSPMVTTDVAVAQKLNEGESVRVGADDGVASIDFNSETFTKIWPVAVGVGATVGDCKFASPWPRALRVLQSDDDIFVMPEGYTTMVSGSISVDAVEPGEYRDPDQLTNSQLLPHGKLVRSFLLQFNPKKAADGDEISRIVGEVTFDQPVIGIIALDETLAASDAYFSNQPQTFGKTRRQLELIPNQMGEVFALSEDRRTVTLNLASGGRSSDHVRVIIDNSVDTSNKTTND